MSAKRSATSSPVRKRVAIREPTPSYEGRPAFWEASSSPERDTPLLLDTHVWLWTLDGTVGSLGDAAKRVIARAAQNRALSVSEFSFWEVAMLVAKGRLELSGDVGVWLERAAEAPGLLTVPVTRTVLVQSTRLPGEPHGDPADRILLAQAQAQSLGASLLTCDRGIVAYARRTPGIPVCDARG